MPAILGLVALLAGCADVVPPSLPPEDPPPTPEGETRTETWSLTARGSRELNMNMTGGASIAYDITSDATVRWDVHSHAANGTVVTHASGEGRDASGGFTAPAAGVYSIYVRAGSAPAVVTVHVEGAFELAD